MKYTELITTLNVYQNFSSDFLAGKLSQAYLFICEDRLTSKVLLEAMGALLVCENQCLCGKCGGCAKSNAGTHPDILIYPKSKSFNVGDAGEIYDKVQVKPMIANRKVFLINDMDLSTEQAQNKMLKIIEEPPQNVVFLISAKNENKILKTIQSRVQKKYVDKLEKNILNSILNCDENIKKMAIFNGDGYLGKTLDIQANEEFLNIYENMKKIIINLKNSGQIPLYSPFFAENRLIFEKSLYILNDFFRDLLMLKIKKGDIVKNENLIDDFYTILDDYSVSALVQILQRLSGCKQKLDNNVNLTLLADAILMEILEVKYICR